MSKERMTKFDNQILFNLISDYNVIEIRILTLLTNRLITQYKKLENENKIEDYDLEDLLTVAISLDFFNKYKGSKVLSIKNIMDIVDNISKVGVRASNEEIETKQMLVNRIEYNKRFKSFKITFNKEAMNYLILIHNNFTLVDLEIVSKIKTKYELGLYILTQRYRTTGILDISIEDLKSFYNVNGRTNDLLKYLRKALDKLNKEYNFNMVLETHGKGKRIDKIIIKFKRR